MILALLLLSCWFASKARTRRQVLAVVLAGTLTVTLIAVPTPAHAQTLMDAIQAVLDVINGIIQDALNAINTVRTLIRNFYKTVIWPVDLINQAKAFVKQIISQYRGVMCSIFNTNPRSATLSAVQALESSIRNQQVGDF
jgi:phage-related protein